MVFSYFLFHSFHVVELFHERNRTISQQKIKTLQSLSEVRFFNMENNNSTTTIRLKVNHIN